MEEHAEDMDDEWEVYLQLLQDQDSFDPAAGEDEAGGPTEDTVTPADAGQDAAPAAGAVGEAAMNTAEAAMDAAGAGAAAAGATMDAATENAAMNTADAAMDISTRSYYFL